MFGSEQIPGDLDVDDQRGGSTLLFEFYGRIVDENDGDVGVLDINPHTPGQAVHVRYDVSTGDWQFRTETGFTDYAQETTLETSQVRLTVLFEDILAPES